MYVIIHLKVKSEVAQSCPTLCDHMDCSYQAPLSMGFLGEGTGVGFHLLLQRIFPTQGSNPGLLHCRQTLYRLSHQGSQRYISCPKAGCRGFPGGASGKESAHQFRRHKKCRFDLGVRKMPWRKAWQPTPVFLSGQSHGQRSLMGYSP